MEDGAHQLVVMPDRGKATGLTIAAAAGLVVCVLGVVFREAVSPKLVAIAVLGIFVFGLMLLWTGSLLLNPRPLVVVDRRGIFDNASPIGVGLIRWEEIRELKTYSVEGVAFLGIWPHDPDAVFKRAPAGIRAVARFEAGVGAPIAIPQTLLPMSAETLRERAESFRPAAPAQPTGPAPVTGAVMLEAADLTMMFGRHRAVDAAGFRAGRGEILGLLGPNGAGKTTTMRMLTTFLVPTSGTATVAGFDIRTHPTEVRRAVGYLPETAPLYTDREVVEYLRFVGRARGLGGAALRDRLDWVRDACSLKEVWRKPIAHLSRGYRQRTGLAQALIHDPPVLILDEPTSGLDPLQIRGIRELLRTLAADKTIVFSTHILQEVTAVTDRVVIIADGRVLADDRTENLRGYEAPDTVAVVRAPAKALVDAISGAVAEDAGDGWTRVTLTGAARAAEVGELCRSRGWPLRELREEPPSFEEAFTRLIEARQ